MQSRHSRINAADGLKMKPLQLIVITTLVMLAFAANSLLCRLALSDTSIDPASFSTIRILSGALMLWLVIQWKHKSASKDVSALRSRHGSWSGALALFIYIAAFSYAYVSLSAGAGALLLFGAVQLSMLVAGFLGGERIGRLQTAGLIAALAGLVFLVLPGAQTPSLTASLLMLASGTAWGVYSLLGRSVTDPALATACNFIRAVPISLAMSLLTLPWLHLDFAGSVYAIFSGALASGLGYVMWYGVLKHMRAITASSVQLSVPVLAAIGGIALLDEAITPQFIASSALILGGIWLVLRQEKLPSND